MTTLLECMRAVLFFLLEHLLKHKLGLAIVLWKLLQMLFQVCCYAFFRCVNKAKADFVTNSAGQRTKSIRTCEEKRIKSAGMRAQCIQAFFTPV